MRVVIALGGNALLKRGERLTADSQRTNVKTAARALAAVIRSGHTVIITHGNGPQVGLLALQTAASGSGGAYPLDVLDAETEGMIGYLPLGTLRDAITYPDASSKFDDVDVRAALERVALDHLVAALDRDERWDKSLSLDEQQRLAFARLLLHAHAMCPAR